MVLGNVSNPLNIIRLECLPTPYMDFEEDSPEDDLNHSNEDDLSAESVRGGDDEEEEEGKGTDENYDSASESNKISESEEMGKTKKKPKKQRNKGKKSQTSGTSQGAKKRKRRCKLCHGDEDPEDLVRVRVDFHYSNTLQLRVDGTQHTGRGLPWVARLAVRTAALAIARNWAAATELGLTIGGHFEGEISLELDMMPSHQTSYPLIRHLRLYAVPKMVLEREFVDVRDELGLIKILMQLVSKDTMIRHIEKAVNQVMSKHLLQEGWKINMRVPAHLLSSSKPSMNSAANLPSNTATSFKESDDSANTSSEGNEKSRGETEKAQSEEVIPGVYANAAVSMMRNPRTAGAAFVNRVRTSIMMTTPPKPLFAADVEEDWNLSPSYGSTESSSSVPIMSRKDIRADWFESFWRAVDRAKDWLESDEEKLPDLFEPFSNAPTERCAAGNSFAGSTDARPWRQLLGKSKVPSRVLLREAELRIQMLEEHLKRADSTTSNKIKELQSPTNVKMAEENMESSSEEADGPLLEAILTNQAISDDAAAKDTKIEELEYARKPLASPPLKTS